MLVGVVACALHFAYEYSVLQLVEFSVVPSRSHIMLPFRHQQVLALFQPNLVAVSVSGAPLPFPTAQSPHLSSVSASPASPFPHTTSAGDVPSSGHIPHWTQR